MKWENPADANKSTRFLSDHMKDSFVPPSNTNIKHLGDSVVMQVSSANGEGTIIAYDVFPGVILSFNDFHMELCESKFPCKGELLCIDHCREGRIEQALDNGALTYVEPGDLKLDDRRDHMGNFVMPISRYHGITISIQIDSADNVLMHAKEGFPVSVKALKTKFLSKETPFIMHGLPEVEHIFAELYAVPRSVRKAFFQIKVLELLLFLDGLELPREPGQRPYFYRSQVEKVKAARDLMFADISEHHTVTELAQRFGLSQTAFKACFKGIYGSPPFAYLREYRMNQAASMLQTSSDSVATIACLVGYDSPSKFSVAFKEILGMSSLEYRRNIRPH